MKAEVVSSLTAAALGLATLKVVLLINEHVPEAYMDEVFHVPQTKRYCAGRFSEWDDKITTLPGLYVLALLPVYLVQLSTYQTLLPLQGDQQTADTLAELLCDAPKLRTFNVLFAVGSFAVAFRIVQQLQPKLGLAWHWAWALEVSTFPLHMFFTFVYYTDAASTFFVLLAFDLALQRRRAHSALAGAVGVFCRQTNAVWVVFTALFLVLREFELCSFPPMPNAVTLAERQPNSLRELPGSMWCFVKSVLLHPIVTLRHVIFHVLVAAAFVAFVVVNGGIVVGDRSNHQATLHFPQLLYFVAFATAALGTRTLWPGVIVGTLQSVRRNLVATVLVLAVGFVAVKEFTMAHRFLLADNRHYTFYVWKNVFRRVWWAKYALLPGYAFAVFAVCRALGNRSALLMSALFASIALVLVPTPLLEFRYFIVPFLLVLLLSRPPPSPWHSLVNVLVNLAVNAATVYIFVFKPFTWPDGSVARFLW